MGWRNLDGLLARCHQEETRASLVLVRAQNGTSSDDGFYDVAATDDGSTVLVGHVNSPTTIMGPDTNYSDYIAVKLDADGAVVWSWQVLSGYSSFAFQITMRERPMPMQASTQTDSLD